jgi:phosphoglycolate phosphatase-like HAD superfamily hydrolase
MSIDIDRIQALCFDVDGTLSDTDNHLVEHITNSLHPVRFLFPNGNPEPFARRIVLASESPGNFLLGLPDILGFDNLIFGLSDFIYKLGIRTNFADIKPIPGTLECIQRLQSHYPLAIISNRGARSTQVFVDKFDLADSFRYIVSAQTCARAKPYPDPILWVADQLGIIPEACLMIGDTTVDIRAGRAAGAQTIGVLCGFGEEDELRREGAHLILQSTTDLPDILLVNAP